MFPLVRKLFHPPVLAQILQLNTIMASKRKMGDLNGTVESDYFNDNKKTKSEIDYAEKLIALENELVGKILSSGSDFKLDKKVAYTYNPLDYAAELHAKYVKRYCKEPKKIMFLGMNPGPHGMVQTGVPFGEIPAVRDFLNITGSVKQPKRSHPKLPVQGLNCTRSEPSGKRLWGLAKELSGGDPDIFFKHAMVYNYFPLSFVGESGKNITPVELNKNSQAVIDKVSDEVLSKVIRLFEIEIVVAIGLYAKKRAEAAIKQFNVPNVKVVSVLHPSPRNPAANKDWNGVVRKALEEFGLIKYLQEFVSMSVASFNPVEWMAKALELADVSLQKSEVPVGCLFIHKNEIIAQGHNTVNQFKNATRHAELNCIDQVVEKYSDKAADIFHETYVVVTVEPCIMCADVLLSLDVNSIYYGCINDRFGGSKTVYDVGKHHSHPCQVIGGVCQEEAMNRLRMFYKGVNVNSPMTPLKRKKIAKLEAESS